MSKINTFISVLALFLFLFTGLPAHATFSPSAWDHSQTNTGNATLTINSATFQTINTTSGSVTLTLPSAATSNGKIFCFKRITSGSNTASVTRAGSDTIDGNTTITFGTTAANLGQTFAIQSDGTTVWKMLFNSAGPDEGASGDVQQSNGAGALNTWVTPTTGSGTVTSSTPGQVPVYTGATTVAGNTALTYSAGALSVGVSGTQGQLKLLGTSSGTATITTPSAAGTPTITLPTVDIVGPTLQSVGNAANNYAQVLIADSSGNQSYISPDRLVDISPTKASGLPQTSPLPFYLVPTTASSIVTTNAPINACVGPDNKVWYSTATTKIGNVTADSSNTNTQFNTTSTTNGSVCAGPDGNIWFTTTTTKVGKCTPAGTVTEYTVTTSPGATSGGIVAGPDGNIWYGTATTKIGKISTSGTGNTEYTTTNNAKDITVGADGRIWYATGTTKIGAVTTSGTVTQYTTTSNCTAVTAGPDGNVWYATGTTKIGKCTPTGTVTEYTTTSLTNTVTVGTDGKMWYGSSAAAKVGYITVLGTGMAEISSVSSNTTAKSLIFGPNGSMWAAVGTSAVLTELPMVSTSSKGSIPVVPNGGVNLSFVTSINSQGTVATDTARSQINVNTIADGRLTLTTNVPVTTSDVTTATTLYYTPYRGNIISTYVSPGVWGVCSFTQLSVSLAGLTAGRPYDAFVYDSNGDRIVDTLELVAWSSTTARSVALSYQDGVLTKSTDARRYVGTIQILATGQCEDSVANRLVWNYYNRVLRPMTKTQGGTTWSYSTKTWRQMNGGTGTTQVSFVTGVAEDNISVDAVSFALGSVNAAGAYCGIGVDSTSTNSAQITGKIAGNAGTGVWTATAKYDGIPAIGSHTIYPLEAGTGTITTTFSGSGNDAFTVPAINASYPM